MGVRRALGRLPDPRYRDSLTGDQVGSQKLVFDADSNRVMAVAREQSFDVVSNLVRPHSSGKCKVFWRLFRGRPLCQTLDHVEVRPDPDALTTRERRS
jgi:hypothetical protein